VGQISEPISTTFGFHLIQVEEKDPQRAKDEAQLTDERNQAFSTWLQEQVTAANVRRGDLTSNLPSELQ
jgi:parvulin-like peptidyl-prolyl isomerase